MADYKAEYSHRNCSYLMPVPSNIPSYLFTSQWMIERTHQCLCSAWQFKDGHWRIWKDDAWVAPSKGDVRKVKQ